MKIINNTNTNLTTDNYAEIKPSESKKFTEMMFNTLNIHSNIGSVIITTKYGQRSFKSFGELTGRELDDLDNDGMKIILIDMK